MIARPIPVAAAGMIAVIALGCATPMSPQMDAERRAQTLRAEIGWPSVLAGNPSANSKQFYPLVPGSDWQYEHRVSLQIVPTVGDPPPPTVVEAHSDHRLTCTEIRDGVAYTIEEFTTISDTRSSPGWIRWRQDATGLYEADVSISEAAQCAPVPFAAVIAPRSPLAAQVDRWVARAPSGPWRDAALRLAERRARLLDALAFSRSDSRGELTRLRYPLFTGAHWLIRDDPDFVLAATVEGIDVLDLPAGRLVGWRIRLETDSYGPGGRVHVWYGPAGYLGLSAHLVIDATDQSGNVIGRVIADDDERLVAYSIPRRGSFVHSPFGP